ncbi:phage minor head protein [Accumulibacter sp.]|uniref:phage minor head protein n=1 Tax=Accumulibacter sp. TaxID=2053492 RepID=UPI00263434EE|nr:phage minor head protein [Accumulibacter sp.]
MIDLALKLLPPAEAVNYFRQKGYRIGFSYLDVWQQQHQAAFTVAKAMSLDLLVDIRAEVDAALANGTTLQTFIDTLRPNLVRRGWWGKQEIIDPQTGEKVLAQLGSPRRLKVIYDTNLRTAHAEGQWQRIQSAKATLPYLLYDHVPSAHERPEHVAWDGLVLPVDDPWWQRHLPVKAWGCKCRVIQLGERQLKRLGKAVDTAPAETWNDYTNARSGETQRVPAGVDPAFHYPPGGRLGSLGKHLAERVERAPAGLGAAAFASAAESLPALMQDYTAWVNAVEGGGAKGLGGRRVIGAVSPPTLAALGRAGMPLESAGVSVEQREISHLFAAERKAEKAVPREWVYGLPERLAQPDAVIHDATPGREALLYVWRIGDERYVRVAVRPNFRLKGEAYTNAVRSAQVVERANLTGQAFTLLEGSL